MGEISLHPSETSAADENLSMGDAADASAVCVYACPHCGHEFTQPDSPTSGILQCPACDTQFFVPYDAAEDKTDEPTEEELVDADSKFDEFRIQQIMAERRALHRMQSYRIIGAATCAGAVIKLVAMTAAVGRTSGWGLKSFGFGVGAIAALLGCVMFLRRVWEARLELRHLRLPEPATPPDFSTLSDGSHQWQPHEKLAGRRSVDDASV